MTTQNKPIALPICINEKWGIIDGESKTIVEPIYESISGLREGFFGFYQDKKHGVMDLSRKVLIEPGTYSKVDAFYDGLASVLTGCLQGFINREGKLVIPCRFAEVHRFAEGLAAVQETWISNWGFIDRHGKYKIEPKFQSVTDFSEGLAEIQTEDGHGYIDASGSFIIPPQFQSAHRFAEGLAAVAKKSKPNHFGFIDKTGEFRIPPKFNGADMRFSEGLAAVWSKGKFGFIDKQGEIKIPYQYYSADHFSCGLVDVRLNQGDRVGFINQTGDWVIEPQFTAATGFKNNVAKVYIGEKWGYINPTGDYIWKTW